jgi:hypothetical protein
VDQQVRYMKLEQLVLWTENPRDPIDKNASNQDVVDKALADKELRWALPKLAKEMGTRYDFSELLTVVFHGKIPVVYDGNRRVILGFIKHALVTVPAGITFPSISFPLEIPCNVCKKAVALENVLRKHGESGSWHPLERDIFLHKQMGQKKSALLIIEEATGLISSNPSLNRGFVKDEILTEENLKKMGFSIGGQELKTSHTDEDARALLTDVRHVVETKKVTTRKQRGQLLQELSPASQKLIKKESSVYRPLHIQMDTKTQGLSRLSARTGKSRCEIFGGKLSLKQGLTNDLYRDIVDLYKFFEANKSHLSSTFPGLIRMSLRLIAELATEECGQEKMDNYLTSNYDAAKASLSQDQRTSLSNHNVDKSSIVKLLQTGAHKYQSSTNLEQTLALSLIVGAILSISLGKGNS